MKLNDLRPNEGSKHRKKRISRGIAAGQGKTGGRGTKGQHSRAGFGGHLYRQGGSLPFFRRLPFMRGEGFTPVNRVEYNVINVGKLADFKAGSEVNPDVFAEKGMLHQKRNPVAILGGGEIDKALIVKAHRFSQCAKEKIEAAGGKAELIEK
jgi:large subunit ribosomal protein L15